MKTHNNRFSIFFVGAGTGGHVLTAISVYKALVKVKPSLKSKILFVGSINLRKGMENLPSLEEKICKEQKINFAKIRTGKVQRFFTLRTIRLFLQIFLGFWDAFWLVLKNRPKVVFATGGYVTPPILFWAKVFGAKTFLHEQTVAPGLASKVSSSWADKVLISFEQSKKHFNKKLQNKIVYTGYPIQREIFNVKSFEDLVKLLKRKKVLNSYDQDFLDNLKLLENAKLKFNKPVLFVTGGSIGAHAINKVIYENLDNLLKYFIVFIQTGDSALYKDYEKFLNYSKRLRKNKILIVRKFLAESFGYVLEHADFVIARSGAGTVYQLGMLKKKAILIPLPTASNNEQYKNALLLKQLGLAEVILQENWLKIKNLASFIKEQEQKLKLKKVNIKRLENLFPINADEKIAKILLKAYESL